MGLRCLSEIRMGDTPSLLATESCRHQVYVIGDVTEWLQEESQIRRYTSLHNYIVY